MTEHTHSGGGRRRPFKALSRMARLGDIPVVVMLAWAGWLAVPWSFSGLAQARAAAAAAAAEAEPPPAVSSDAVRGGVLASVDVLRGGTLGSATPAMAWGIPAHSVAPAPRTVRASRDDAPGDGGQAAEPGWAPCDDGAAVSTVWPLHDDAPTAVRSLRKDAPTAVQSLHDDTATAVQPLHDEDVAVGRPCHGQVVPPTTGGAPCDGAGVRALDEGISAPAISWLYEGDATSSPYEGDATSWPYEEGANQASGWAAADVLAVERARIAGEVHDAAGHGLAAIAMQAGLALITLDDDPEQARASLLAIKETSTTALTQLRAALDRLDPRDSTHGLGNGVHDLPSLIDGVRAAGLPVDVEPADAAVPAHLSATVYGVVRESLTNVLRHAGPTRALVRLSGDPAGLVLEIADRGVGRSGDADGRGRSDSADGRGWSGTAEGRGLAGMRARVTAAGGHFTAGPRDGGGFQVLATFPESTTPQRAASQSATLQGAVDHQDASDRLNSVDSPADLT
ncbi:sensor histidine kinase [Nonomuraea sp. NPDC049269]|uniref:sensor histidine kinase n=1 Tax=Nonomuraea sp. NPDC049269 TaxID=3364349 RepID=UPI0037219E5E